MIFPAGDASVIRIESKLFSANTCRSARLASLPARMFSNEVAMDHPSINRDVNVERAPGYGKASAR
jgi:hypothetical protein